MCDKVLHATATFHTHGEQTIAKNFTDKAGFNKTEF